MKSSLVEEILNNETLIANLTESRENIDAQIAAAQRKVDLLKAGLTKDEALELNPAAVSAAEATDGHGLNTDPEKSKS